MNCKIFLCLTVLNAVVSVSNSQMIEPKCCPPGFTGIHSLNDCKQYYHCLNGEVQEHQIFTCNPGLIYDEARGICNYPDEVASCDNSKCGPYVPSPECESDLCCPPDYSGSVPINQCADFYVCDKGELVAENPTPCHESVQFNFERQQCEFGVQNCVKYVGGADGFVPDVEEDSSTGTDGRCCPDGHTGNWPEPGCQTYYYCQNGVDQDQPAQQCGTNTFFDTATLRCQYADDMTCPEDPCNPPPPTAAPVGPPTDEDDGSSIDDDGRCCPGGFTGDYPEAGCETFYACIDGVDAGTPAQPCSPGTLLNIETGNCEFARFVECPYDPCDPLANSPEPSPAPTKMPVDPSPVSGPAESEEERCCPAGFTGNVPVAGCATYYACNDGVDAGAPALPCGGSLLFDFQKGWCREAGLVNCPDNPCNPPTPGSPEPSPAPSPAPTKMPVDPSPVTEPTESSIEERCCPAGFTGNVAAAGCASFYACSNGVDMGTPAQSCSGLNLFDVNQQRCRRPAKVNCPEDPCNPPAPTSAPSHSMPTKMPVIAPSPQPTSQPTEMPIEEEEERCCPEGFTGKFPVEGCGGFYTCENGVDMGMPSEVCKGIRLFDIEQQRCLSPQLVACPPATAAACRDDGSDEPPVTCGRRLSIFAAGRKGDMDC